MKRENSQPRADVKKHFDEIGFAYAHMDGEPYWDESVRYVFTLRQIEDDIEKATSEIDALCHELVWRIVASEKMMDRLHIPKHARDLVAESFRKCEPSLYGRFDFAYDGASAPKLLEFNADTPTSLFESAVVQWHWLEQLMESGALPKDADQFNALHDKLIARWETLAPKSFVHFAAMSASVEDFGTAAYLADCATQAGCAAALLDLQDIGLKGSQFCDRDGRRIETLFKLYPWEWMFADEFSHAPAMRYTRFVEPPWKALLSNKGMLALLWELAPGHPNLLECHFADDPRAASLGESYAKKPIYSREGANVVLIESGRAVASAPGSYGSEGHVRQALHMLPCFDGRYPVIGSWVVGGEPAGMGIREDSSPVTSNRSRFIPHAIVG
ncbi:glutathionylspermidine synthase family protein [Methylocystis parvus]|uniref:Glutathionylspermidine synthase family protein n=1 Tax=Methylocystis parvus TaxID=134 RepID=A0A6B8M7V4_9HYPH|nr:glutathionylspermidine synthase family protein [Methylocystis parvus]QGM98628.1 glutathionylspermidine synthase family protein [Methylocystis parvus]WBK01026.1 glutathionylspermidine synthase family protein [Methylocystis parvus OBBP]